MAWYGLWCVCLVALVCGAPSPKRQGVDVERTVAQVEEVLRQNANLPRLSREEIMQLLNDIRAEDERSASASSEHATNTERQNSNDERTVNNSLESEHELYELNEIDDENDFNPDLVPAASSPPQGTTSRPPANPVGSLMVVLPYTPRDGASLQELYTRPPRVALLRAPAPMRVANKYSDSARDGNKKIPIVTKPVAQSEDNSIRTLVVADEQEVKNNYKKETTIAPIQLNSPDITSSLKFESQEVRTNSSAVPVQLPAEYPDVSSELQEFLRQHGLHGNSGAPEDHFLLPLDGFKPLPPARFDSSVELPENILLTYDLLIPPLEDAEVAASRPELDSVHLPPESFVYEPLQQDVPFELEALSSETKNTVVPLDRKRKAAQSSPPNYNPIEYDSVKVIPLKTGPDPLSFDAVEAELDLQKRQSENSTTTEAFPAESPTSATPVSDAPGSESSGSEASPGEATTIAASEDATTTITPTPSRDSSVADSDNSGPSIADLESSFGAPAPVEESDAMLPPPRKNGFYWMLDWNSFLEVGDGDEKVNIRFEPKLGDPQMFLPVSVP